jgi:hypothetical protein
MSNTSSNVKPSPKNCFDLLLPEGLFIVAIGKDKRQFAIDNGQLTIDNGQLTNPAGS